LAYSSFYVNTLSTSHSMPFARLREVVKEQEIYGQADQTGEGGFNPDSKPDLRLCKKFRTIFLDHKFPVLF